jgi:hypothetical protein
MAIPLHVLVLEDLPADALLMVHELRQAGFDPVWQRVETEADYVAHLQAELDVILADYRLPQFNALRALQLLQERGGDTPFLIVSATIGEDLAVAAMQQGAADYLLKDRLSRLGPAVARALQEVAERRARQQAEADLCASEARFRMMAEAAPVLLWMAGEDMGCTYFNERWLDFTGRTMEQELGYGWADNVHPEDAERYLALYTTAFTARQPFEMEYRLRRADGVYRWVLDRGVPLEAAAGHFGGYIGSAIDNHPTQGGRAALAAVTGRTGTACGGADGRPAPGNGRAPSPGEGSAARRTGDSGKHSGTRDYLYHHTASGRITVPLSLA